MYRGLGLLFTLTVGGTLNASAQATVPGWTVTTGATKVTVEQNVGTEKRTALCAYPPAARPLGLGLSPSKLRAPNTFAGQDIRADRYRGKQVRISADVFAENLAGFGLIGLRVYGPFGLKACWLHPIEATRGWEHQPWDPNSSWGGQCDVPSNALGIQIYLDLNAAPRADGRFCLSKVDVSIIGPAKEPDPAVGANPATFDFFENAPLEPQNTDFKGK